MSDRVIVHKFGAGRRSRLVHLGARAVAKPALSYYPIVGPTSRIFPLLDRGAAFLPRLSGTKHQTIETRTWRGEVVTPYDGPTSGGAIVFLHGGAFIACGLNTHRRIVERLALRTGMTVLAVDYRQWPAATVDFSIDDAESAYQWLLRKGHRNDQIVLMGDSAGGHLAFATALRLRDSGAAMPIGLVGLSPWLDFDHLGKKRHHNNRRDAYIPAHRLRRITRLVLGITPEDHHSPVNADLRGLPPVLMICGEGEVLRYDAELMADRLDAAGIPCTLQVWEHQVHAFPVLGHLTPETRESLDEIADFVVDRVAAGAVVRPAARALRAVTA